jgi:O-antigen/teichoic acid export membrane protein
MVSFYTAVLSTEIYGKIDVIFATINLLIPIASLSINNAILRFSLDRDSNRCNVFGVGCKITAIGSAVIVVLSILLNIWFKNDYLILAAILLILEIWYLLFSEFIRGMDKNGLYVLSNIVLVVITSLLNILFLGYYKLEIYGYLYAYIFAYGICCTMLMLFIHPIKVLKSVDKGSFRITFIEMLRYSVYLIPNAIFWWITDSSDKYIIVYLIGSAFNGIYSVANKIPTMVTYTFQIFIQAWQLSAIKEQGNDGEEKFVNDIFDGLYSLLAFAVSFLLIIIKPFISIYVSNSYYIAWQSASILVLTSMFNILSSFVGIRYVVMKKNKMNMYTTLLGAALNIVLNILMIPKLKLVGAAIATFVSYFIVFVVRIIDTKKYLTIRISKRHYILFFLLLVQLISLFVGSLVGVITGIVVFAVIGITNITFVKDILVMYRRKKRNEIKTGNEKNG